jgi:hypothetical protein
MVAVPGSRARCVRLTTSSKMPSYVQVITCIEMARSAHPRKSKPPTHRRRRSQKAAERLPVRKTRTDNIIDDSVFAAGFCRAERTSGSSGRNFGRLTYVADPAVRRALPLRGGDAV